MKLPQNATPHQKAHHFLETTLMPRYTGIKSYQPLKVGAYEEIRALHPKVREQVVRDALFLHCTSFKYLSVLKRAKLRVGLFGEPAGEVTEEQHRRAKEKLRTLDRARKRTSSPDGTRPVKVSLPKAAPLAGTIRPRPGSTNYQPPTVIVKKRRAVMA